MVRKTCSQFRVGMIYPKRVQQSWTKFGAFESEFRLEFVRASLCRKPLSFSRIQNFSCQLASELEQFLQAEILVLRHQPRSFSATGVIKRSDTVPRIEPSVLWLSHLWTERRSPTNIVKPETIISLYRKGFRLYWRWKSRHPRATGRFRVKSRISSEE